MTNTDVAAVLGIRPKTLTNWRHLRKGPTPATMNRPIRYRRQDVERWIADQASATAASEGWS
ncbi:helix-turn-helix domain-containing protein [Nocardioides xinjiangensis]|uniref:helix-turn-helix domain-containing protein n=1 Tax=Nocardioides xinjiangensis TaxID=2817376 RepID=UPI001B30DD78|nr:helix-turn-helix domain-containing protein [Nocardioides sp. SYSU D00514]